MTSGKNAVGSDLSCNRRQGMKWNCKLSAQGRAKGDWIGLDTISFDGFEKVSYVINDEDNTESIITISDEPIYCEVENISSTSDPYNKLRCQMNSDIFWQY